MAAVEGVRTRVLLTVGPYPATAMKEKLMQISRSTDVTFTQGDDARFTGTAWLDAGVWGPDDSNAIRVSFEPGARTHWHQHPEGQIVAVLSGRGRMASRGEATIELAPGDLTYTGPGEWHWHGATPTSPLATVAFHVHGAPEWGEPVTDEEYGA